MKIEKKQQVWDLWIEYEHALKKYVFKYIQDEDTTNDIVHEVLLKVHKSCCSGRKLKNVRSWLFQIAFNSVMDFLKNSKKEIAISIFETAYDEYDVYQDFSIYLEPLISRLPKKYSEPLKMADIDGLRQQQIADKLGLTLPTTKSRIQRARKLLRKKIHCCFHINERLNSGLTDFKLKQSCTPLINWERKNN